MKVVPGWEPEPNFGHEADDHEHELGPVVEPEPEHNLHVDLVTDLALALLAVLCDQDGICAGRGGSPYRDEGEQRCAQRQIGTRWGGAGWVGEQWGGPRWHKPSYPRHV